MPQQHTALKKSLSCDFTSLFKLWSRQTGWKSSGQDGFERRDKEDDARCCSIGVEVELFKRNKQKHREGGHLCSHFTAKQNAQCCVRSPLFCIKCGEFMHDIAGGTRHVVFFHFICSILLLLLVWRSLRMSQGRPAAPLWLL